eukprot:CAMPEP_0195512308 /NCGR_PEP_ID=MMETSP0794_2-20130614/4307_1 /TAXON_ID=515487 /ORGANISM="Stephanopyxis turris, Strain CCMP 815" /LENGTH=254 /DNA_ID=CAMNT_0040640057 /DNA_START=499 /DNA_END=1260 /DNA_ORIENTATION=-
MANGNKFTFVFTVSMLVVTALYAVFASLSVAIFGNVTNGSFAAFLVDTIGVDSEGNVRWLVIIANIMFTLSLLLTYPLQLFPSSRLLGSLKKRQMHCFCRSSDGASSSFAARFSQSVEDNPRDDEDDSGCYRWCCWCCRSYLTGDTPLLRTLLVLITFSTAMVIPNVQELVSISGAVAGSLAALIIPPLIDFRYSREKSDAAKNCFLIFIGVVSLLVGTYSAVYTIWKSLSPTAGPSLSPSMAPISSSGFLRVS